ncbi:protein-glutamate O-methyltransferase CheR [Desulfobacula sp.]|uniref:CheR family methyltransferase n=1 Tax=Desulfobacula sp. TaxID=2593537 RepID=UPI0026129806|nr:protein-glutamate O-methyltransferase CheR [Desulfobacula sp.]
MTAELRDIDFGKISRFVYEKYGINLHAGKKELVKARLGKRLRDGNFRSFAEYFRFVTKKEGADELTVMIDSLSTNLTSFFREDAHFHRFRKIIPGMAGPLSHYGRLRIWCAGCSTGEEAYSLAMTLKEALNGQNIDTQILASDISTKVLKTAMAGVYPNERVKNIPNSLLRKYFQIGQEEWEGYYRVKKDIKDIIKFMRFNLMEKPPFNNPFDSIFCRNVMIYFDKETQEKLINRFYDCLKKDGWLFIGHSESLTGMTHPFKYVEPSVYRK